MSTTDELSADEILLLDKVPADASNVGNISLRRQLGWEEVRYWPVRDSLYAKGKIGLVRCRGGGIRKISAVAISVPPPAPAVLAPDANAPATQNDTVVVTTPPVVQTPVRKTETDYYSSLEQALRDQWAKSMGFENCLVQLTAQQGRRDTGGAWTRPDIVLANVSNYRYVPGRQLDIITFEVKVACEADVKAVYEALAHTRAATNAYLALVGEDECAEEELNEIKSEAAKHGVGLIVIKDPAKIDDWKFLLEPRSITPDASSLEEFIETQLTDENKRKISLWVK